MKKSLVVCLSTMVFVAVHAVPVAALEILVDDSGTTKVYQDGVLGDSTENESENEKPRPTRTITPQQEKMIRVRNTGDEQSVELIDKDRMKDDKPTKLESERLRLKTSAAPRDDSEETQTERSDRREMLKDVKSEKVEERLQERSERKDTIELRRATAASESALELRSRDSRAVIQDQHEVIIDPETNEIGIVLKNGEIKSLNHLPDQAQARIDQFVDNAEGLELTTLPDGTVVYMATVPKAYRFLGLFKRNISTDVVLDDSTGEVTEEKRPAAGLNAFLNALSF